MARWGLVGWVVAAALAAVCLTLVVDAKRRAEDDRRACDERVRSELASERTEALIRDGERWLQAHDAGAR